MKIKIVRSSLVVLSLVLCAMTAFAAAPNGNKLGSIQCPAVDCDCEFIESDKWQKLCRVRERSISLECSKNRGKPKGYCGLHGPDAFPVATSIQFKNRPKLDSEISPKSMAKAVETQIWSLYDDFKVLKTKEGNRNVVEAIQIVGIFKKSSRKLFNTQQQVILGFKEKRSQKSAITFAKTSSKSAIKLARELNTYGDELWKRTYSLKEGHRKKAYKSLAFKIMREAATLFERAGDLSGKAKQNKSAANIWQQASAVSKKLLKWEVETSNKPKYVAYYQKQATARLNRATVYWLKAKSLNKATANIQSVSDGFSVEEEEVLREMKLRPLHAATMD